MSAPERGQTRRILRGATRAASSPVARRSNCRRVAALRRVMLEPSGVSMDPSIHTRAGNQKAGSHFGGPTRTRMAGPCGTSGGGSGFW